VLLATALSLAAAGEAGAWFVPAHRQLVVGAVGRLPAAMPAFFREHSTEVAESAGDPDDWRNDATPELADGERAHHFIDLELLGGARLPERRSDYLRLLAHKRLEPTRVGLLPYSIVEGYERLLLCFASARRRPGEAAIEAKCRVYAGLVAHYAADLEQPLHTTIHWDGRAGRRGEVPHSGLHELVDGLLANSGVDVRRALAGVQPARWASPWAATRAELAVSHSLVDRVYALEPLLRRADGGRGEAGVQAFATERYRASVVWLESLFWSAWEGSAGVAVPLRRP